MSFDILPEELKILVFSQLRILKRSRLDEWNKAVWEWDSPRSLTNVALCCRKWNEPVTPILYSTIVDEQSHTTKFLRTLLDRSDLASYVKTYSSDFPWVGAIVPNLIESPRAKIKTIIRTTCTNEDLSEDWYEMVFGTKRGWDSGDAMAALVIALLPNLLTLELPSELQLGLYINLVISKASQLQLSGNPGRYCTLQHIEVSRFDDDNRFFDFIAPFIQLSSVKSLTFGDTMMLEEDFEGIGVPAPHITHLSFLRADIHPQTISPLLEHFPSLTHFSYIHQSRDGVPYPFRPRFLREGIQHLQHSLLELIIVNREKDPEEEWQLNWNEETHENLVISNGVIEPEPSNFGPLNVFQGLRRLETTVFTLVGPVPRAIFNKGRAVVLEKRLQQRLQLVESLPMSLEELVLWNCREEVGGIIRLLLDRRRQGEMRKLKMVELVFLEKFDEEEVSRWQSEGKMFRLVVTARNDRGQTDGPTCYPE
jgi:hypothetical protein